ncbi:hypothetical protein Tco_0526286 [Tanacetum coccineum]
MIQWRYITSSKGRRVPTGGFHGEIQKEGVLDVKLAPECNEDLREVAAYQSLPGESQPNQRKAQRGMGRLTEIQKGFQKQATSQNRKPDRKQIDEMIKAGKLSQFIKELKQNDKPKAPKKGETAGKERPLAILMVQPWERVAKQKVTQSFSPETTISFPPLGDEDGTKGPMIIEAEIGGHFVHS